MKNPTVSKLTILNYDEWLETYKPWINHLTTNASFDNLMYETFGKEYDYIKNRDLNYVWTLIDDSEGGYVIVPGRWLVNRLGYFVCQQKWDTHNLEVQL